MDPSFTNVGTNFGTISGSILCQKLAKKANQQWYQSWNPQAPADRCPVVGLASLPSSTPCRGSVLGGSQTGGGRAETPPLRFDKFLGVVRGLG